MKILKKESKNSRIVQKHQFMYGYIIARQRKAWWGWKTVDYLYTMQCKTVDEYIKYFDWHEENKMVDVFGISKQY